MRARSVETSILFTLILAAAIPQPCSAQEAGWRSVDRGSGVPSSIFGTTIESGELILFPFFAYSTDHNREYETSEFGATPSTALRGKYRDAAGQIFVGYGLARGVALEFETALLSARLEKSPADPSHERTVTESGLTDIEGQLRVRLLSEAEQRPEFFGFVEITAPSHNGDQLIGDAIWDFKPGLGVIRGFSWGTLSVRSTGEYSRDDRSWVFGETAIEYLKRLSPALRLNLAVEGGESGAPDEWDLVTGVQWRLGEAVSLKLDNAAGLSSKATDWAPQAGVLFSFKR